MAYIVYCLTNKINGKKYVGITSQSVYARWQNGKHYNRQKSIYEDIKKYGWDNFNHEILYDGLTEEKAKEIEIALIKKWDLLNDNKGYNKNKGGVIPKLDEKAIEKLKERNSGENNPFYGKRHSKQTIELIKKNRPKKSVLCVDTGVIYESTREAQRQTGAYHGDISKCCKGILNIAGGLRWQYAERGA